MRRKHRVTKNNGRKASTPKRIFSKVVTVQITGTDVNAIKETASNIYALQNDHTSGGKFKRKVQITKIKSTDINTLFYGRN